MAGLGSTAEPMRRRDDGKFRRNRSVVIDGTATLVSRRVGKPANDDPATVGPLQIRPRTTRSEAAESMLPQRQLVPVAGFIFQEVPTSVLASVNPARHRRPASRRSWPSMDRTIAVGVAAAACLVIATAFAAAIWSGRSETASLPLASSSRGLVITEATAAIEPRGDGDVLSVEGLIRNTSGSAETVPPILIALYDKGGQSLGTRPMASAVSTLDPGDEIRFRSFVAVENGTSGDIAIGFRRQ
ncbi:FxLYD domain-containing protein [Consotaella aegiceratis]|uniref:FxLYD domain-containing protein n=1 Tax=Consotaella aegiceratis TaxID=3097961 RepID=UPI002F3EC1BE